MTFPGTVLGRGSRWKVTSVRLAFLFIMISKDGKFQVGDRKLDNSKDLFLEIKRRIEKDQVESVVIKSDKHARFQSVITAIDCLKHAGIDGFSLAVMQY